MDKKSKLVALKDSFDRCREVGAVRNQQEFADLVGVTASTMSSAMNENERALTDSLVAKAMKVANELTNRVQLSEHTVPIVPYAVRGGALQGFSEGVEEWECERITSPIRGAELAFEVTGDSMAPAFPAGARVLLKRVKSVIAWGEMPEGPAWIHESVINKKEAEIEALEKKIAGLRTEIKELKLSKGIE